jgi:hypothetical protein
MPPSNNAGNLASLYYFTSRPALSLPSHHPPLPTHHHTFDILLPTALLYSRRSLSASWAAEREAWPQEHTGAWRWDAAPREGSHGSTPSTDGGESSTFDGHGDLQSRVPGARSGSIPREAIDPDLLGHLVKRWRDGWKEVPRYGPPPGSRSPLAAAAPQAMNTSTDWGCDQEPPL